MIPWVQQLILQALGIEFLCKLPEMDKVTAASQTGMLRVRVSAVCQQSGRAMLRGHTHGASLLFFLVCILKHFIVAAGWVATPAHSSATPLGLHRPLTPWQLQQDCSVFTKGMGRPKGSPTTGGDVRLQTVARTAAPVALKFTLIIQATEMASGAMIKISPVAAFQSQILRGYPGFTM